jgi:MSHA biogenesis protein MshJ
MKARWQAWMARLDGLSLRERLFLFLSILVCCFALADTLWLTPAQTTHKQLLVQLNQQGAELQRLRDGLRSSAQAGGPDLSLQQDLLATQARLVQVNEAVRQRMPGRSASVPLTQALVQLLRRHQGLTLVRTSALPPETAGPGKTDGPASLPPGLSRQGVTLTVAGPYAELTRYVASLESAMPYVRWAGLTLTSADQAPAELSLQLFLLAESAP